MLPGKGMYIWVIKDCELGNYIAIREACVAARLRHVVIKIADRYYDFNIENGIDQAKELTTILKAAGITVYGWQYTYGDNPSAEGAKGAARAIACGVQGFIVDAESEYKTPGAGTRAVQYMTALRAGLASYPIPIGLASYRFPSVHQEFPWSEFRTRLDFDMPQVYWQNAHNPAEQLVGSYVEYSRMTPKLPYVPTGSAYLAGGWVPTEQDIKDFLDKAVEMGFTGANFWEYGRTKRYAGNLWPVISDYNWPDETANLPKLIRISLWSNVTVRATPNGKIIGIALKNWLMVPTGVQTDSSGKTWYKIDPGWVLSTQVTPVEV